MHLYYKYTSTKRSHDLIHYCSSFKLYTFSKNSTVAEGNGLSKISLLLLPVSPEVTHNLHILSHTTKITQMNEECWIHVRSWISGEPTSTAALLKYWWWCKSRA
jgi:hypothetical protein